MFCRVNARFIVFYAIVSLHSGTGHAFFEEIDGSASGALDHLIADLRMQKAINEIYIQFQP